MKEQFDLKQCRDRVSWVVCVLGIYGMMRLGELLPSPKESHDRILSDHSIRWISPNTHFILHLDVSKTDPFRQGVDTYFFADSSDRCPVTAIQSLPVVWSSIVQY